MIKIDIVVQNYLPERMAAHYTSDLAEALAKLGWDVRVITALPHAPTGKPYPGYGSFLPSIKTEFLVNVWRVPIVMASNRQLVKRIFGFASFMVSAAFASTLGRRPDVVIVSLPSIFIWPAMLVLSKLRKIPVILLLRDVEPLISFQLRGVDQAWWAKIVVSIFSKLYAFADGIVLVHESQRASLPFNFSNTIPIAVVDHGVDLDRMSPDKAAVCNLKLNKFRPDDIVVLYTGTFGVAQDLVAFLEAISSDEIKGLPFSFFFIGDGEQSARMAQLKKKYSLDRVIIHTPVSRHEVVSILDQADVLLMSYKKDSRHISGMIGSKFYEYCASGKPILVFGYGVASNLVESIGNGWRCDTGEVADLGMQLERIIKSHDRNLLGIRGREYARIHFDKKQRHRKWIQIIKDSLERR